MFKQIHIDNPPPLSGHYELQDGALCRVTLTKQGSANGHVHYEAQAWLVNADGQFITDASGFPIRTPGSVHGLHLSAVANRTATRDAGWVKVPSTIDPTAAGAPDGYELIEGAPTGESDRAAKYFDTTATQAWAWSDGELEGWRQAKAEEMAQILAERALDAE
jgi:hypothetical protein